MKSTVDKLKRTGNPSNSALSKPKGQAAEALFKYECLIRGIVPHTPEGDQPCHDLVTMNPLNGRTKIVQVRYTAYKTVTKKTPCPSYSYKVLAYCNNKKLHLRDSFVDVLAVLSGVSESWYLIPIKKIDCGTLSLFPHIENSQGKWERYQDNWRALGALK